MRRFISAPLKPIGDGFVTGANGNEPPIPSVFTWKEGEFHVTAVLRSWRSTKTDRGDTYLKRHWYALQTKEGPTIEIYFDRDDRRAPWWLYAVGDAP